MADEAKKSSLKDVVYQKVIELIINGEIRAGEIVTESQMIERFQVSKSPVREALIQLCYEEVLRSIPRCGYQVVQISAKNIHDITELRLYLELSSLQKISETLSEDTIQYLKSITKPEENNSDGKEKWKAWHDNIDFHLALTDCAGNSQVTKVLERTLSTCTRAYAQIYEINRSAVVQSGGENHHQRIVKAIENHDIYIAHENLRNDILVMEQQLLFSNQIVQQSN